MKPLSISMTAFGPYAEKTIIDFRELNQGVYLIAGDTGAGKTTIFDAIVFALYGEGSGSARGSEMFHSDYVDKFTDTVVELDFMCRGKEYKVTRTIHYKKKRGDGGVGSITKNAVLYIEGELPIEKETAVNAKITELLGMDDKQFRQIVMLAQGEFRKFLEAKSDAREQILGKLFDNRIYVDFQNRLKMAAESLKKEREEKEREIGFYLSDGLDIDELKEWEIKEEAQKAVLEEKISVEGAKADALQNKYLTAKQHNDRRKELNQTEEKCKAVAKSIEEKLANGVFLEKAKQESDKNLPVIDELKLQIQKLQKCSEDYEKYEKLLKEKERLSKAITASELKQREAANKIEECQSEQTKVQISLENLKNVEVDIARAEHELEKQEQKQKHLAELKGRLQMYQQAQQGLKHRQEKWQAQQADYEASVGQYLEKNRLFLAGQAGLIAEELRVKIEKEESGTCPVCGSQLCKDDFSKFAKIEEGVPSQDEVEKARVQMEEEQEYAVKFAKDCENLKTNIENDKNDMLDFAYDLFGEFIEWEALIRPDFMGFQINEQTSLYKKKQNEFTGLKEKQEEKDRLEKRITALVESLESAKNSLEDSKKTLAELEKAYAVTCSEAENLKANLAFSSKEKAEEQKLLLEKKKDALELAVSAAEQNLNRCREELSNLKGQQESLLLQKENRLQAMKEAICAEAWLAEYKMVDVPLEAIQTDLEESVQAKKVLEKEREELLLSLESHRKSLRMVQSLKKELEKTETAYQNLWKLSSLANGQSGEGGKYSFSRYVLGSFFEEIIGQANLHLDKMTGGKYELIRQQEAERKNESAGLGMMIYDAYTGEKRDTASLSGGESFQVSLSLALGLSDVVRSRSGGYTLDTMFIDEGFGSLDEQALDQAMEVLNELAGDSRQIGIISHVGKLSENISQKIYVRRSPKGSSVQILK